MLTFLLCLLPILASVFGPTSARYIVDIDYNTLKNVRFIDDPDLVLSLSSRNLHAIEKNAFDRVTDVISLDLSNNWLTSLPEFIFFNLTKLESLSLANNRLFKLQPLFLGLKNLTVLDISRNPITHLRKGSLFGLPKFVRILIDGNNFESFSSDMYSNPQNEKLERKTMQSKIDEDKIDTKSQKVLINKFFKDTTLKICQSDGIITSLNIIWTEYIWFRTEGCIEMPFDFSTMQVDLHDQNITGFRKNWYRLYDLPILSLDLSGNRIAEIKKEMLSKLSSYLKRINLQNNEIRKIRSHVIENHNLRHLDFENNSVEEIASKAFAKTGLHYLNLNGNRLRNLNFVSTLPDTISELTVGGNRIISISNNIFPILSNLSYLNLRENKIETLQNNVFQNLTSLQTLILAKNDMTTIEPASFGGLTTLKMLDLQGNFIRDLQASTFAELTALDTLDLSWNKIVDVMFTNFPRNLNTLYLDFNEISALEKNSFTSVPKIKLSLSANKISRIARGAFNIPNLRELSLDMNRLTTFENDITEGMGWGTLRYLWLQSNQISEIRKRSTMYLESLYLLDISYNPLQKLEAGALYGLNTDAGTNVHIMGNNLKEIQGGLFDDI